MTAKALRLGAIKTMQQTESEASLIGRLRVRGLDALGTLRPWVP